MSIYPHSTLMNILELMKLLNWQFGISVPAIAERLEVSERTVRRYISTLRMAGYIVGNRNGLYYIDREKSKKNVGIDVGDLLYFSKEEAQLLSAALSTIDVTTAVRENLIRKMYSLYDNDDVFWKITREEEKEGVKVLIDAIRNGYQVIVQEFTYTTANRGIREFIIEPLGFAFNYSRIWAYSPGLKRNFVMRLSGMAGIKATGTPFKHKEKHHIGHTDPFRGYGFENIPVRILMDLRAYGLMVDEFPLTIDLTKRVLAEEYELRAEVCNFREIGRFILGLHSHILEIEPPELQRYVEERHNMGLDPTYKPTDKDAILEHRWQWE